MKSIVCPFSHPLFFFRLFYFIVIPDLVHSDLSLIHFIQLSCDLQCANQLDKLSGNRFQPKLLNSGGKKKLTREAQEWQDKINTEIK